ncbi:MAG: hypothetical protein QM811_16780 [Pirellulales bacterium]
MAAPESLQLASLTREQLAQLLTKAGGQKVDVAAIAAAVTEAAPTNANGTLHFVHFTAWLASRVS